jgi:phage gpG-like protein
MRTFNSLGSFAAHLLSRDAAVAFAMQSGLEAVAQRVRDTAREELGTYQPAIGHFDAWPELADSTKADRVAKGFSENDPLLRSGELRESIKAAHNRTEAIVGSDSDVALYQELGTNRIPARPFLGPAVLHNEDFIKRVLGRAFVAGFLGENVSVGTQMTSREIS